MSDKNSALPGWLPPHDRPRCRNCAKAMPQYVHGRLEQVPTEGGFTSVWVKERVSYQAYRGLFCTMRCALAFAEAAYNGGFRRPGR
jgi:hypothetical protein